MKKLPANIEKYLEKIFPNVIIWVFLVLGLVDFKNGSYYLASTIEGFFASIVMLCIFGGFYYRNKRSKKVLDQISNFPTVFIGKSGYSTILHQETSKGLEIKFSYSNYKQIIIIFIFALLFGIGFTGLIIFMGQNLIAPVYFFMIIIALCIISSAVELLYEWKYNSRSILFNTSVIKFIENNKVLAEIKSCFVTEIKTLTNKSICIANNGYLKSSIIDQYSYIVACDVGDKTYHLCTTDDKNESERIKDQICSKLGLQTEK